MIPYKSDTIVLKDLYDYDRQEYSLVIPEYQRSYLWKKENFEKLIDSLLENFSNLSTIPSKTFFLGAVIFSKSKYSDNRTLKPFDVVDGQQRITSLCLLMISLYKEICYQHTRFQHNEDTDTYEINWVSNEVSTILELIQKFLFVQERVNANLGVIELFMPRIIRQNDKRDKEIRNQRYDSSISQVLNQFKK